MEQIDNSRRELLADGLKVGACTMGNTGSNPVKYIRIHRFCSVSEDHIIARGYGLTKKSVEGRAIVRMRC